MQTIFKALEPKYGSYTYELRDDTQKFLVIKKKTGTELSETETIAQLVKEYNLAYEKQYTVLTLMNRVGEITSKEIVYQDTENIRGYELGVGPLSNKVDMSKITTVKAFIESFLSPMGAYEAEITATKIILKQ